MTDKTAKEIAEEICSWLSFWSNLFDSDGKPNPECVAKIESALAAERKKREPLEKDAKLANDLCELLVNHAGETGQSEGAVAVLTRKLREAKEAQVEVERLRKMAKTISPEENELRELKEMKKLWDKVGFTETFDQNSRLHSLVGELVGTLEHEMTCPTCLEDGCQRCQECSTKSLLERVKKENL